MLKKTKQLVKEKQAELAECDKIKLKCKNRFPENVRRKQNCMSNAMLPCVCGSIYATMECIYVSCYNKTLIAKGFINIEGKCVCGEEKHHKSSMRKHPPPSNIQLASRSIFRLVKLF